MSGYRASSLPVLRTAADSFVETFAFQGDPQQRRNVRRRDRASAGVAFVEHAMDRSRDELRGRPVISATSVRLTPRYKKGEGVSIRRG